VGEAAANSNCGTVTLTEKSSMEGLPHTGLITDLEIRKSYLERFSADLEVGENYQVYVTDNHGSSAGHYEISKITLDRQQIILQLEFLIGPFEMGAGVLNHRILFLKTEPTCEITKIILSYPQNNQGKKK
jgi:hypothetical protein